MKNGFVGRVDCFIAGFRHETKITKSFIVTQPAIAVEEVMRGPIPAGMTARNFGRLRG